MQNEGVILHEVAESILASFPRSERGNEFVGRHAARSCSI